MNKKRIGIIVIALSILVVITFIFTRRSAKTLVLSGIVTTEDVLVSPQIAGRLVKLNVHEGDVVTEGQLLAEIEPSELKADSLFYSQSAEQISSQVDEVTASLRYQEQEMKSKIQQATATIASLEGDSTAAGEELNDVRATYLLQDRLVKSGGATNQERDHSHRALKIAEARLKTLSSQIEAQQAILELAKAGEQQVIAKQAVVAGTRQAQAASVAQSTKADLQLGYSRITAPIDGLVDVRVAHPGEFIAVGQPIVTLINPDDFWVRVDLEESYIDKVRIGDHLQVHLPSGYELDGTVTYRGVDAAFATQRDVSQTKRDIRTFEIRLRVDNKDRRLALGSTASVLFPLDR